MVEVFVAMALLLGGLLILSKFGVVEVIQNSIWTSDNKDWSQIYEKKQFILQKEIEFLKLRVQQLTEETEDCKS